MISTCPTTKQHTQTEAKQVWEINHNSAVVPIVAVAIEIGGVFETILPKSIRHEENKIFIEFSKPRTGVATLA